MTDLPLINGMAFDQRMLHRARVRVSQAVSLDLLHRSVEPDVHVEETVDRMVFSLERDVMRTKLLAETQKLGAQVVVPWSCHVTVPIPNPWWRRWLRLPERVVHQRAAGTVKAWVQVEASAEHFVNFPELPYFPPEFGRPVPYSTWKVGEAIEYGAQTSPERGVAERWE